MTEFDIVPSTLSGLKHHPQISHSLEHKHSPANSVHSMPPSPLVEANVAENGFAEDYGGEFDLSDEQTDQLLRELDLLGAQLQQMDQETKMLTARGNIKSTVTTSGPKSKSTDIYSRPKKYTGLSRLGLSSLTSDLDEDLSSLSGSGVSVTPYRMQLVSPPESTTEDAGTELPDNVQLPSVGLDQSTSATDDANDLVSGDAMGDSSSRSVSAGRPRKPRKLFEPRKPTTAEALMAVDISAAPLYPVDMEPLELVSEPSKLLSPKTWLNSVSRIIKRNNNDTASNIRLASGPDESSPRRNSSERRRQLLERSRTVGSRPRPRSMMVSGTSGSRRGSTIFDEEPAELDFEALVEAYSADPCRQSQPESAPLKATPSKKGKEESVRKLRAYSMGFFSRSKSVSTQPSTPASQPVSAADAEADQLLRQLDELATNPKMSHLNRESSTKSVIARRPRLSRQVSGASSVRQVREEATMNDATQQTRRRSMSVFTFA